MHTLSFTQSILYFKTIVRSALFRKSRAPLFNGTVVHSDLLHKKKKLTQITKVLQFLWRREHSFSDSKQIFQIVHLPLRKCAYVIKPSICEVYHCVEQQCKTKGNLERITLVILHNLLFCECLKRFSVCKIDTMNTIQQ